MYPIYRAAVLLVIPILCFSCKVTEDSETVVFRMEEFRTVELSYKEGEQVAIDGLEFGRPYTVRKHKDGFLFVREVKGDRQLMAKSITLNSIYNFILKVFRLIVPVLVGPYIQRLFDTQLYGSFNDASTWVDLALVFGSFGI